MKRTIAYARYINYKGSADFLTQKSLEALAVKKEKADRLDENLEQYLDIIFEKPVSLQNEMECWYLLLWKISDALEAYPTTLEEDGEILIHDRHAQTLTYNQKNCIRLRFNDKVILESLKQTGINILELASMTRREAIDHLIENPLLFKKGMKYVQDVFIPLLKNPGDEEQEELRLIELIELEEAKAAAALKELEEAQALSDNQKSLNPIIIQKEDL